MPKRKRQSLPVAAPQSQQGPDTNPDADVDADARPRQFWLLKAEPESRFERGKDVKFSIQDLRECTVSCWDGVRNYEARNNMRRMKLGELGFFYHSNCKVPGIAGIVKICKEAYPDHTAWDSEHPYFDPKSKKEDPRWFMVDVEYVSTFTRVIPLKELQQYQELQEMQLVKRGRLSVQQVTQAEFDFINTLASISQS
ncbi:Thymocyte nuclear protein 1 [Entophlyctis luteolus]|nr:Thymocyte nuclear protein 1 [Entophlyctis luteolus]KAJ3354155.1 Thymocyte nuclear protein 1 [Entophlyctis luteolus]